MNLLPSILHSGAALLRPARSHRSAYHVAIGVIGAANSTARSDHAQQHMRAAIVASFFLLERLFQLEAHVHEQ